MNKLFSILAILCAIVSFIAYCVDGALSLEPIYFAVLSIVLGFVPGWVTAAKS